MSGQPVRIVVEEEAAEAEGEKGGASDFRVRGFVDEEAVALVVIEGEHLIRKIRDDEAGIAGAVVIGGGDAHACARDPSFTIRDA